MSITSSFRSWQFIFLVIFSMHFGAATVLAEVDITLPDVEGTPGEQKQVPIDISQIESPAYSFDIHFDETIAEITEVEHEGTLTPGAPTVNTEPENQINVAWAGAGPFEGEGILLYITVEFHEEGETDLTMVDPDFSDPGGDPYDLNLNHGSATVVDVPEAPEPQSPADGATNIELPAQLEWDESPGAESYQVQVAGDDEFDQIVYDEQTSELSAEVTGLEHDQTYYWRIRGENEQGAGVWSDTWNFTTIVDIPDAPELTNPVDGAMDQPTEVELDWQTTEDAEFYQVQVAMDESFTDIIDEAEELEDTEYDLEGLEYDSDYFWRVRATNVAGDGDWSQEWGFTTIVDVPEAPELVSPEDDAMEQPVELTLQWDEAIDAETYHMQLARDENFTDIVAEEEELDVTEFEAEDLEFSQAYYWRVRSENVNDVSGWSATRNFATMEAPPEPPESPELVTPDDGAQDQPTSLTLQWSESETAETYQVQLAADESFTDIIDEAEGLEDTEYDLEGLEYDSDHFWRVRATNEAGQSDWSQEWNFTTVIGPPDTPELNSPEDDAIGLMTAVLFDWEVVSGAETYSLQLSEDSGFNEIVNDIDDIEDTSQEIAGLDEDQTYYWRVNATNVSGNSGWSAVWSFTTAPPAPQQAPELLSPEDGSEDVSTSLSLEWQEVEGATWYELQVATDENFEQQVVTMDDIEATSTEIEELEYEEIHYWRVRAANDGGSSDWSEVWNFTTEDDPLEIPDAPELATPEDEAGQVEKPAELHWEEADGAETYTLQLAEDSGFDQLVTEVEDLEQTNYSVEDLEYGETYYWRVASVNEAGSSDWSEVWNFTTEDAPLEIPDVPELGNPENEADQVEMPVELHWEEIDGAETYTMQVAEDSEFDHLITEVEGLDQNSYNIEELEGGQSYNWRVASVNEAGTSDWSEVWSFSTEADLPEPISLSSPEDGSDIEVESLNDTLKFTWRSGGQGITYYELEVATDEEFNQIVYDAEQVDDTTYVVTDLDMGDLASEPVEISFWWRVRGVSDTGAGSFSDPWNVEVTYTSTGDEPEEVAESFHLDQNYPNPFNPTTTIGFELPERSEVTLEIYDSLGRYITTLVNGQLEAGSHQHQWNAETDGVSSGTYIYRLEARPNGSSESLYQESRNMILIK